MAGREPTTDETRWQAPLPGGGSLGRRNGDNFAVEDLSSETMPTPAFDQPHEGEPLRDEGKTTSWASLLIEAGLGEDDLWEALVHDGRVVVMTPEEHAEWSSNRKEANNAEVHRGLRLKLGDMALTVKHLELRFGCDMGKAISQQRKIEQVHLAGERDRFKTTSDAIRHITGQLDDLGVRLQRVLEEAERGLTPYCHHTMDLSVSNGLSSEDVAKGKSMVTYMADTWSSVFTSSSRSTDAVLTQQAYLTMTECLKRGMGVPQDSDDLIRRWLEYTRTHAFRNGQEEFLRQLQLKAEKRRARGCCSGHGQSPDARPVFADIAAGEDPSHANDPEALIPSPNTPTAMHRAFQEALASKYHDARQRVPASEQPPDTKSVYGVIEDAGYPESQGIPSSQPALQALLPHDVRQPIRGNQPGGRRPAVQIPREEAERAPQPSKAAKTPRSRSPSKSTRLPVSKTKTPSSILQGFPSLGFSSRAAAARKPVPQPTKASRAVTSLLPKRRPSTTQASKSDSKQRPDAVLQRSGAAGDKVLKREGTIKREGRSPPKSKAPTPPREAPRGDFDSGLKRSNAVRKGSSRREPRPTSRSPGKEEKVSGKDTKKDADRGRSRFR